MTLAVYLVAGGLIVLGYVTFCLILHRRGSRTWWYCVPLGFVAALTYAVNMWYARGVRGGTLYNGLRSDNSFQVAYINNVLHGNYLGDFYDKIVPSHYPPLYFWVAGTFGRLAGADAIATSIAAPFVVVAVAPLLVFLVGRRVAGERAGFFSAVAFLGIGNAMVSYVLPTARTFPPVTWSAYKPYELLAALLAIYWTVESARLLRKSAPTRRDVLQLGLAGGLLILLYYPWFLVSAATLVLLSVVDAARGRPQPRVRAGSWAAAIGVAATVSSPAWAPYAITALTRGADPNYALQYTTLAYFDVSIVTLGLGYAGGLFLLAAYGFIVQRGDERLRSIVAMALVLYAWYLSAFITYPLLGEALLSWKARILIFVVLCLGAGIGLDVLRRRWSRFGRWASTPLVVCLATLPLLPTIIQWNPVTDAGLRAAAEPLPPDVSPIVHRLGGADATLTVVSSPEVATYLPAVSQLRLYTSHTIHFSNPLALFSQRRAEIEALAPLTDRDLAAAVADLGVDALILDKLSDGGLQLFLPASARPTSIFDGEWPFQYDRLPFRRSQFTPRYFELVYESERVVVLRLRPAAATLGDRALR